MYEGGTGREERLDDGGGGGVGKIGGDVSIDNCRGGRRMKGMERGET